MTTNPVFGQLFKKYRLHSQFESLSEFGAVLSETGFVYEDSIFYKWQKGVRVPQNRNLVIKLLEIFIERKAITKLSEANEFLVSTGQGGLSEQEIKLLPLKLKSPVFQVPKEVTDFTNREEIIHEILKSDIQGKIVLIHGPAGVGKTAVAIKLGHLLKEKFSDGVLWYKVEEDNIMDILLSIARIFGEDISNIHDKQVRATVVRSLISSKNALIFLDNAEMSEDINLLLPNSQTCTTIITSQKVYLKLSFPYIDIAVNPFTQSEVLQFFRDIFKDKYKKYDSDLFLHIAKRVGNLPLALHILIRQLQQTDNYFTTLPTLLKEENTFFNDLYHEDKNLYSAIAMGYKNLDTKTKSVLLSVSIFKGKDFSAKSIAYINGITLSEATKTLQDLMDLSLIESSTKSRFRMHPAIQEFMRDKLNYPRSSYLIGIASVLYLALMLWWSFLVLFVKKDGLEYSLFSATYGVMILFGGFFGVNTALKWGGLKSVLGRSILMFSLGLLSQEFGQIVYSYYDFTSHASPFASLGEIGFLGTIPFYIYGAFLLTKSSGIKINIQSFKKQPFAFILPLIIVIMAYILFFRNYVFNWHDSLKTVIDFVYPLGDATYISIAIVTFIFSRNILDGIMKSKAMLILGALVVQFTADYLFLYTANDYYSFYTRSYIDFLCLLGYFIMTIALLSLKSIRVNIKNIQ